MHNKCLRFARYVAELMKYVSVDSFGKCFHNKDIPDGNTKVDVVMNYKFTLAFEYVLYFIFALHC